MANRLKMAKIDTILALYQRRWSIRRIAKELGVHRLTVARTIARHLQLHGPPPESAPFRRGRSGRQNRPPGRGRSGRQNVPPQGGRSSAQNRLGGHHE